MLKVITCHSRYIHTAKNSPLVRYAIVEHGRNYCRHDDKHYTSRDDAENAAEWHNNAQEMPLVHGSPLERIGTKGWDRWICTVCGMKGPLTKISVVKCPGSKPVVESENTNDGNQEKE